MGLFDKLAGLAKKEPTPPPAPEPKEMELYISNAGYFREQQESLLKLNPYYGIKMVDLVKLGRTDSKIYKYRWGNFIGKIIPEPENPHDKYALKLDVEGVKVGHINRDDQAEIRKLMRKDKIKRVEISIHSGPFKIVEKNETGHWHIDKYDEDVYMEVKLILK